MSIADGSAGARLIASPPRHDPRRISGYTCRRRPRRCARSCRGRAAAPRGHEEQSDGQHRACRPGTNQPNGQRVVVTRIAVQQHRRGRARNRARCGPRPVPSRPPPGPADAPPRRGPAWISSADTAWVGGTSRRLTGSPPATAASTATWSLASSAIRWAMNAPLDTPATTARSPDVPCRSADQPMIAHRNATSSTPASSAVVTPRPSARQAPSCRCAARLRVQP